MVNSEFTSLTNFLNIFTSPPIGNTIPPISTLKPSRVSFDILLTVGKPPSLPPFHIVLST